MNILVLKESRAGETRVALVVDDVALLLRNRNCEAVLVESGAGVQAGFTDKQYEAVGATIVDSPTNVDDCGRLFDRADVVVRCKRPSAERQQQIERGAFRRRQRGGMHLVAVIDVLAKDAVDDVRELNDVGVQVHSIDQLDALTHDDPMNLLAAMSRIAGRLALQDAINEFVERSNARRSPNKLAIIGFGVCGESSFLEAKALSTRFDSITVICSKHRPVSTDVNCKVVELDKSKPIDQQQQIVFEEIEKAGLVLILCLVVGGTINNIDIVITCARNNNQRAPLLIPLHSLKRMTPGTVVIDMALTEGGKIKDVDCVYFKMMLINRKC